MRNGRPCSCGCETCDGYLCSLTDAEAGVCPEDRTNYLSFYENFDEAPLETGWDYEVFGMSAGRGVIATGDYVYDSVTGTSLRSPMICSQFYGSTTFFSDDYNHYYGKFGYDGGPQVTVSSGNAYLLTPTGTVQIDDQFKTGDNYRIELVHSRRPNETYQYMKVKKRRNDGAINSSCLSSAVSVTPYPSGCQYTECTLYNETYIDPSGTLYSISSPVKAFVALSGTAYKCDDVCFNAYEASASNLLEQTTMDSGCTNTCGYVIGTLSARYQVPCVATPPEENAVYSDNIYILWRAYKDKYLDHNYAIWCDPIPGSSVFSYLRTEIKSYQVDMLESNIFHVMPLGVNQYFDCYNNADPFENSNCNEVGFSGAPCVSNCYSPPYFTLDNIMFDRNYRPGFKDQANVSLVEGTCKQVGSNFTFDNPYGTPINTYQLMNYGGNTNDFRGVEDLLTIPRNDRYSTVKNVSIFGSNYSNDFDDSFDAWSVENIAYKINWDSTNRWWHGNMRHLSGSGISSVPNPGGSGAGSSRYTGADLSIIYTTGTQCENHDIYIYGKCAPNNSFVGAGVTIDIISSSGDLLSRQDLDFTNSSYKPVGDADNFLYYTSIGSHNSNDEWVDCNSTTRATSLGNIPIMSETYYYNMSAWYNPVIYDPLPGVTFNDDCVCTTASGDIEASGTYNYTLYGRPGFLLNVGEDYDPSYLPAYMLDCMGAPIIRGMNFGTGGYGNVWLASDPILPGLCEGELGYGPSYYDLVSGNTVNNLFSETDLTVQSTSTYLYQCISDGGIGYFYDGGLPMWGGNVIGHYYMNSQLPIDGTSYGPEDWNTFGTSYHDMCRVTLFMDKQNNELRALIVPHVCHNTIVGGDGVERGRLPAGNPSDWTLYPYTHFIKSESDIINNTYFAQVTVLNTNPLKLRLIQSFMSWGQPYDSMAPEDDCTLHRLYGFNIEVILEAPTLI